MIAAESFIASDIIPGRQQRLQCKTKIVQPLCTSASASASTDEEATYTKADKDNNIIATIPHDISCAVRSIAKELWAGSESKTLDTVMMTDHNSSRDEDDSMILVCNQNYQGEMPLPSSICTKQRFAYFMQKAKEGDPRAQHSIGLLLWNGFAASSSEKTFDLDDANNATIDPDASARWHAAAAVQGNIDALAVFGGCLRTGTGVVVVGNKKCKNISLGLRCIEYAASIGNPSGINKKAAMMESNDDYHGAMRLYRECYQDETKRINALLLFNLGYCLVHHGEGINRNDDVEEGEQFWKSSVERAPEEGAEEAAWFLYQQYSSRRDTKKMASYYLNVAADLGLEDAEIERREQ